MSIEAEKPEKTEDEKAEKQKTLFIVGGAFNYVEDNPQLPGSDNFLLNAAIKGVSIVPYGLERLYSRVNKGIYAPLGRVATNFELFIPSWGSVFNLDRAYEQVEQEMLAKREEYSPDAEIYGAGVSLGAVLLIRFMSDHPEIMKGALEVIGPHKGSKFPLFTEGYFGAFSEQTADQLWDLGEQPAPTVFLGAQHDRWVPLESAHPRNFFPYDKPEDYKRVGGLTTGHYRAIYHADTIAAAREMIWAEAA